MTNRLGKFSSANLYSAMLHLIIIALAIEVFILVRQNRQLKTVSDQVNQTEIKTGDPFWLGELVPATTSNQVDSSVSQLVYVFTTRCPFCKQNSRSWEELSKEASAKQVHVAGVCLDKPEKASRYATDNQITYDVYVPKDYDKFRQTNRIKSVPTTVFRSRTGLVERVWFGVLRVDQIKEIGETISLTRDSSINQRRQQ